MSKCACQSLFDAMRSEWEWRHCRAREAYDAAKPYVDELFRQYEARGYRHTGEPYRLPLAAKLPLRRLAREESFARDPDGCEIDSLGPLEFMRTPVEFAD